LVTWRAAFLPPLLSIRPPLLSVFDAGLVADAGGEKRASRSGCQDEQERSCDPLRGEGVFHCNRDSRLIEEALASAGGLASRRKLTDVNNLLKPFPLS
jgi:hypothetical protein